MSRLFGANGIRLSEEEKEEKKDQGEDSQEEEAAESFFMDLLGEKNPASKMRVLGLYGEVNEKRAADVCFSLLTLREMGLVEEKEEDSEEVITTYNPMDFYVSTFGGSVAEMFSIYDVMRQVRKDMEIKTIGIGKVMSSGVLILAAGTKGKRQIGEYCRVMIHGVRSGAIGTIPDMEAASKEIKYTQKLFMKALLAETKIPEKKLRKILNSNKDHFFDAEEAVALGIADEII